MHVAIDASRAATARRTGTEGYAYHLIRALLPLLAAAGHRSTLYFNQPPGPAIFPSGVHVRITTIPFPRLWTHLRLGWALQREKPDIFFTPAHVIPISYFGTAVATVHDLGYRIFPEAHPRSQRLYLEWSTRHNAHRSRQVLTDSRATKRDLGHFYGVAPEKVRVVYPGVDPTLAPVTNSQSLAAMRARYNLPADYLLYLGTLQPRKNLDRLVQAYVASGVAPDLVLAGKAGWLSAPILNLISKLQAASSKQIHLPGFIADEDKAALLSGATALLFPSLYEGFGFPVLEAQACATPVLTANNSSLPEVAGAAALLVDAEDTVAIAEGIRRVTGDPALRAQLVEEGLENVKRFTWEEAAKETLDVLEKAAGLT